MCASVGCVIGSWPNMAVDGLCPRQREELCSTREVNDTNKLRN